MALSWKIVTLLIALEVGIVILGLAHVISSVWIERAFFVMLGGLLPVWVQREKMEPK